ncbi:MAG: sigma-54-dependent Fis family transcriptional regulator [Planctomycetaceae bacterium]|nr:sigma-54-dependent Fis family transcriptional regulator [Planctomycetaceae bacterium]
MVTVDDSPVLKQMIGDSTAMREVYQLTRQVAESSATVLLTGETGTGKELIAEAIHELSPRASGPYIRVNCGALSENLLESELFGHVKGAFTSAHENRTGRFEAAHGGTIFLDEINSVSFKLQVKLLRVLQQQEFERVGDTKTIRVDCRVVAATNRDLLTEVEEGRFREDLYYRLNVVPVYLPSLSERGDDVIKLTEHFLKVYAASNGKKPLQISPEVADHLRTYAWPGNVRELQNYVERAVVLSTDDKMTLDLLPGHVKGLTPVRVGRKSGGGLDDLCTEFVNASLGHTQENIYQSVVSMVERELIAQVLKASQGVQTRTASKLGINRNTLHKKIEEYGLEEEAR